MNNEHAKIINKEEIDAKKIREKENDLNINNNNIYIKVKKNGIWNRFFLWTYVCNHPAE